jgi:hypothetical protein
MQVLFRFGDRLLPLVAANGPELREQLVLVHLHSPAVRRPVGQQAEHSERGRTQNVDRGTQSVERFEEMLGAPGGDAAALRHGLEPDRQTVANRAA